MQLKTLWCLGKDCGRLQSSDGLRCTLNSGSSRYPHAARCECIPGYERRTGSNDRTYTRSCQADGSWSSPDDRLPTTCKSRSSLYNHELKYTVTASNCMFICPITLYKLFLPGVLMSLWAIHSICQVWFITEVTCGSLPAVPFSCPDRTNSTGSRYQDTATYTCLPGYKFTGTSTVSCQANRQWSTAPQCVSEYDCNVKSFGDHHYWRSLWR